MGPKNKGSITRRTEFGRTPISDIFGGLLRSRIHRAGDQSTDNIQPFFTLQLNIEVSLLDLLLSYSKFCILTDKKGSNQCQRSIRSLGLQKRVGRGNIIKNK